MEIKRKYGWSLDVPPQKPYYIQQPPVKQRMVESEALEIDCTQDNNLSEILERLSEAGADPKNATST